MEPDRPSTSQASWRYPRFTPRAGDGARRLAAAVATPLALEEREWWDPAEEYLGEPGDPLESVVQDVVAAGPRQAWEMEQVVPLDGGNPDDGAILTAVQMHSAGQGREALELLHALIAADPRCLDAHGHLGNFAFAYSPGLGLEFFARGVAIGERSLPEGFDGVLPWGWIDNRPFMRCLHGYGLCLWRLRRHEEAVEVFETLIWLNPSDNVGARFMLEDVRAGVSWERHEEAIGQVRDGREALLERLGPVLDKPPELAPEQAREGFEPLFWLLECAREDGLPLTETGVLGRSVVREMLERFPYWWPSTRSDLPNRESDVRYAAILRELARAAGLLHKRKKKLLLTKRGRGLLEHPEECPRVLAPDLIGGDGFDREVAELAFAVLLKGEPSKDEMVDAVSGVVTQRWRTGDGDELPRYAVSGTVSRVLDPLHALGAMSGDQWEDEDVKPTLCGRTLMIATLRDQACGGPLP